MNASLVLTKKEQQIFDNFCQRYQLNQRQAGQFLLYIHLLLKHNKEVNLTAIETVEEIIERHFQDSLALADAFDCTRSLVIVDVGSGGGFPGIPLKIAFPQLIVILIEVTRKKIDFLHQVIERLGLNGTSVYPLDWRTFLRKTTHYVDLFVARASLDPHELIRLFKPSCPYRQATLVYWASQHWEPDIEEKRYIQREYGYVLDDKNRRLIFLGLKEANS